MPRVQAPEHGASERFVVSPGREESGIFHMPGGQSGHPLSPHYRDGHQAWEAGRPTPFLPGPTAVARLTLRPVREVTVSRAGTQRVRASSAPRRPRPTRGSSWPCRRIASAAVEARTLDEALRAIHAVLGELIEAQNLYVALVDETEGVLRFVYIVDERASDPGSHPWDTALRAMSCGRR